MYTFICPFHHTTRLNYQLSYWTLFKKIRIERKGMTQKVNRVNVKCPYIVKPIVFPPISQTSRSKCTSINKDTTHVVVGQKRVHFLEAAKEFMLKREL